MRGSDSRTRRVADHLAILLVRAFAAWTCLTHAFLLGGGSLDALIATYAVVLGVGAAFSIRWASRSRKASPSADAAVGVGLILLCAMGAAVALLTCRPNADDVIYASRAVYFLEHPHRPLDLTYHDLALPGISTVYPLTLGYSIELLWAAVSRLTSVPYLHVYHGLAAATGGALIPLAWFVVMSRFVGRSAHALLGATVISAYLCVDGSTFNTFGNLAFVRIWQGKALLLSVGVPLFVAFSMDWLRRPNVGTWLRLFTLSMAASGLTSTALFLLPLLAGLLGAATFFAEGVNRNSLRLVVGYGASLGYVAAIALIVRLSTTRAELAFIGEGFLAGNFRSQAMLMIGPTPITPVVFLAATAAALALLPRERRFLSGWLLTGFVLLLNPLVMPLVAEYATTANGYWRLFYALPFPLVLGLVAVRIAERSAPSDRSALAAAAGVLALAVAINLAAPGFTTLGSDRFALGPKLRPALQVEVEAIVAYAEPGSMLAPLPVSTVVPLYTSALPQIAVRGILGVHFAIQAGRPKLAEARLRAVGHVWHPNAPGRAEVERLLERGLRNVVFDRRAGPGPELQGRLEELGFRRNFSGRLYVLFSRPDDSLDGADGDSTIITPSLASAG
jgi:hypothetical protein